MPPVTKVPRPSVQLGSQLGPDGPRVLLRWSATDDQSRIARYALEQSKDDGPWKGIELATRVSRFSVRSLERGHAYRFRARAWDASDNTSAWATGAAVRPRLYQEGNRRVKYAAGWTDRAIGTASGGSVRSATTPGSSATLTFTGRAVAWISPKRAVHGLARISLDRAFVRMVDLSVGPTGPRRVAFIRSWLSSTRHRLTVRVVDGRIDIDAFVVLT
jgi:hypothetical protein